MLNQLVRYAREHHLVAEPGFAPKKAHWAIACDAQGQFLDILPLGDAKGGNGGREFPCCPELSQPELKGGGEKEPRAHFLVESAEIVAFYVRPDASDADAKKVRGKHAYFVQLLRRAAAVIPELNAVADLLEDEASRSRIHERLGALKAKPTDKVTISLGTRCWVESDDWHDWWRAFRRELNAPKGKRGTDKSRTGTMVCLATGQPIVPAATHPKVIGLHDVGGLGTGSPLIGYDKDAFLSYGLQQSANGAVSEESATAYRAALNDLLKRHHQRLAGTKVVHWFSRHVPPQDDPLPWLKEPDSQQELTAQRRAAALLRSIQNGERADLANNRYYVLTLSGASGRVMVRDWTEGPFEELVAGIEAWFSDLAIVNYSGSGLTKSPGIERVITSLLLPRSQSQKYVDWVKPVGAARTRLWAAALRKEATIPFDVLARVVILHQRFVQTGRLEDALKTQRDVGLVVSLLQARMGLLKTYHLRKSQGVSPMTCYLNENHPEPAYHCGRLMAVLADLQQSALGDVGAGIVQRYYAAASATPALVLGRLTRTSQFHLNKLERGLAYWYESRIADIWSRVENVVPPVLSLEQQSLFALGYYQQIAADRARRATNGSNATPEESHA